MIRVTPQELAKEVKKGNVMIFSGAGMSTESGLPDFRSHGDLWSGMNPMEIASRRALHTNFEEFTSFYRYRVKEKNKYSPHNGHYILAKWEDLGLVNGVVTQNVDGYHSNAGSEKVYELHGSLSNIYCEDCKKQYSDDEYLRKNRCNCKGRIRPGIVLFGESLPMNTFNYSLRLAEKASTLIVIGTSLLVSPANLLPARAKQGGANIFLINRDPVDDQSLIDFWLKGSAKEILEEVDKELSLS